MVSGFKSMFGKTVKFIIFAGVWLASLCVVAAVVGSASYVGGTAAGRGLCK